MDSAPKFQIPTELADKESIKVSPWDYYTSLRYKSWNELSEYEKGRMVLAAYLILEECRTPSTLSEIEEFLKSHLPERLLHSGDTGVLRGFKEYHKSNP